MNTIKILAAAAAITLVTALTAVAQQPPAPYGAPMSLDAAKKAMAAAEAEAKKNGSSGDRVGDLRRLTAREALWIAPFWRVAGRPTLAPARDARSIAAPTAVGHVRFPRVAATRQRARDLR